MCTAQVGRCVVEVPYQVAAATRKLAARLAQTRPDLRPARTTLLFFAGSFDVCCRGWAVRCAVGALYAETYGEEGVLIRPTGSGRCTQRALAAVANRQKLRARAGAEPAVPAFAPNASHKEVGASVVKATAHEMATSVWCLVPAGDTCETSRLYSAVALGCLPVVLCDELAGAMPERARWSTWWLKLGTKAFIRDPLSVLRTLRAFSPAEVARRQALLRKHQADVLWDVPHSRVGTNLLLAAAAQGRACAANLTRAGKPPAEPRARSALPVVPCIEPNLATSFMH